MSSEILNQIGLGSFDLGYILIGMVVLILVLLIVIIVQGGKIGAIITKQKKFMQGKDAKSLEKSILNLYDSNRILKDQTEINHKKIRELSKKQRLAFQKFGLIKYDAFRQMGGELSFCLVMLNDKNDGYIINTVHGTDGSYSYTKELRNGICKTALGDEEKLALDEALK